MNSEMMNASFKHEDLVKELLSDIDENLVSDPDPNQCCIYKVPEKIRRINEEVYTPQLISIGPLHHGKEELVDMEVKKRSYMKSFFGRITNEERDKILNFIMKNEKNIRNCYEKTSKLKDRKYVMMILYDAIFIIELFLRNMNIEDKRDSLLARAAVRDMLSSDLELLENQLPYFILEEIHKLAFVDCSIPTFMELSCCFFSFFEGKDLVRLTPQLQVKHFTDWRRISTLLRSYPRSVLRNGMVHDVPCAVKLHDSGVKFKCIEGDCNLLDIKFEKLEQLIPFFEVHELQIPHVVINDNTEPLLRNMMALEQCEYPKDTQICNYVNLLDYLINTEKDVDLLVENGIISNDMGDNASVANMFNKLCKCIHVSSSTYYNIGEELKEHYNNPWNKKKATLRRVYFSNLWKGTGTLAAVILLLLTIIQTIFSILQVV